MKPSRLLPTLAVAASIGGLLVPAHAATGGRQFSAAIHVDAQTADMTGEPSIAVAPDGAEYIVAPDGPGVRAPSALGGAGTGGSLIWRSTDHGRTWTRLGSYDVPTGGGDSDIAVSPDGTLYASGLSYVACSTVARSTDRGDTWLDDPVAGCGRIPLANDRQWTAVDGSSTVYTAIGDTVDAQIDLVRSAMTNPVVVPSSTMQLSTTADYQWPGTVAVDQRNGNVYTVWNTTGSPNDCDGAPGGDACKPEQASSKQPDKVLISMVPRSATTPAAPITVASRRFDTYDSFVVDTVDKAGNIYVVWSERHPQQHETWTMLSVSRNGGRSWTAPTKVERAPATTVFPWVSAGDGGRIAVSYYGTTAPGNSPQTVAKTSTWYVYSAFSTDGGRTFSEYRTTPPMHHGSICTSGTGCATGSRNLLDFFETAVDGNGCLVTSYADNTVDPATGAVVSYVRQTGGPGLRAGHACHV
ncbi:MAG TPA: sialidase family protein [Mycobacteriales bacterium]|nr:sialidase family protein [Mycobacteriales bacterium]